MTKTEFLGLFLGYIIKKSDEWLPEESTETHLMDVMQERITEHSDEIKEILNGDNK